LNHLLKRFILHEAHGSNHSLSQVFQQHIHLVYETSLNHSLKQFVCESLNNSRNTDLPPVFNNSN